MKIAGLVGVSVVALFIVGCCCGGSPSSVGTSSDESVLHDILDEDAGVSGSGGSAAESVKEYSLNERFELGGFAYTLKETKARKRIGNQYFGESASEGGTFLVVKFTIENLGTETATVMTDDFKLLDHQGREFRTSSNATTALMMEGESQDFLVTEIQPGLKKTSVTAFEVPEDSIANEYKIEVPEKGFLGTGKVHVVVSP